MRSSNLIVNILFTKLEVNNILMTFLRLKSPNNHLAAKYFTDTQTYNILNSTHTVILIPYNNDVILTQY